MLEGRSTSSTALRWQRWLRTVLHACATLCGQAEHARREKEYIGRTRQLVDIIGHTRLPGAKGRRKPGAKATHPATRTFQALRIAVNDELRACEAAIPGAIASLRPGGRLAVLTFHSLEDRIVKWAMREAAGEGAAQDAADQQLLRMGVDTAESRAGRAPLVRLVGRRPLVATQAELDDNPRARSAKLRIVEKLA
jgi:16S rRNA (cytosine1402-N4)-methyltransferase